MYYTAVSASFYWLKLIMACRLTSNLFYLDCDYLIPNDWIWPKFENISLRWSSNTLAVKFVTMIVVKLIYSEEDDSASLEDELDDWFRGAICILNMVSYVKLIEWQKIGLKEKIRKDWQCCEWLIYRYEYNTVHSWLYFALISILYLV